MAAWMRGCLQWPGKRKGGEGPVLRVRRCAAAVSGMGLGKCGVRGVWLNKALRPQPGNEGLEQGMTGWNAVLGGS